MFCKGERVRTPQGAGTVVYARMAPPAFSDVEVYSVRLDHEARQRPKYQGTIFSATDVAKQEE